MLKIDGSHGEGGGQILRTTLSLATILQQPVELLNIRGGRKKPGLRPQHLMAAKAMASITAGHVEGADLGSTRLCFEPRRIVPGDFSFHVGTAGSSSLVLQTMIPALLFAGQPSRVAITGGTHVPWSPCFHYLKEVFFPILSQMGGRTEIELERWGWYPKGGGKVVASIQPVAQLQAIDLTERGGLRDLYLLSAVSNLTTRIGERQREEALKQLRRGGCDVLRAEFVNGPSPGTGTVVFVRGTYENGIAGFTSLGKKGKSAEKVAQDACSDFLRFAASEATIDKHLADQLLLYMALAKGRSSLRTEAITRHLETNMWLIEQFLSIKFEVDKELGTISVEGTDHKQARL
ncbi:MAG: RNA 3'-terminal phosphate cyclase [Deltaproteobacteria bacterium]|nr:RNA 3'-terminal phosphate cyclase [Deltaproteobacteria bacterium]